MIFYKYTSKLIMDNPKNERSDFEIVIEYNIYVQVMKL